MGSLGSEVSSMILGDVFFRNYVATFDKVNSQVGFYGETDAVEIVGTSFFQVSQYAMLALLIILMLFSVYLAWVLRINKNRGSK